MLTPHKILRTLAEDRSPRGLFARVDSSIQLHFPALNPSHPLYEFLFVWVMKHVQWKLGPLSSASSADELQVLSRIAVPDPVFDRTALAVLHWDLRHKRPDEMFFFPMDHARTSALDMEAMLNIRLSARPHPTDKWSNFLNRYAKSDHEHTWLFSPVWQLTDPTVGGLISRIVVLRTQGVPDTMYEQLFHHHRLSYRSY